MMKLKIFYKTMIFMLTIIISYIMAISFYSVPKIEKIIYSLEEHNAKDILDKIVILSKKVYINLEDYKEKELRNKKKNIVDIVNIGYIILEDCYLKYKQGLVSEDKAKEVFFSQIEKLRYGDNGYFFVLDNNYTILSHPKQELRGESVKKFCINKNAHCFVKGMVDRANIYGDAFAEYSWVDNNNKSFDKLSYIRVFNPWSFFIASGVSIDNIKYEVEKRQKELFKELTDIIKDTKIGDSGYVYILDKNGVMLIHPNKDFINKDTSKFIDPLTNNYIFQEIVDAYNSGKVLNYKWDKPTDNGNYIYDKISWIEYIPELGWYVVSSAYKDELNTLSNQLKYDIYTFGIIVILIFLISSFLFFRNLFNPILSLSKITSEVSKGDYSVRSDYNNIDEIGLLCKNFNFMIDTIEDNIKTLDKKVYEKTKELNEQKNLFYHKAHHDGLTGLPNRILFNQRLNIALELAMNKDTILALFFIDLDKFKNINDSLGHKVGDEVLKMVSKRFANSIRGEDTLARLGGDEFMVIIENLTKLEDTYKIATKVIKSFDKPFEIDNHTINISVSIGISIYPQNASTSQELIKCADIAMYKAKERGRNNFKFY